MSVNGFTQHGNQDYIFGFNDPAAVSIATTVGLKPQTLSISGEPEFTAAGTNLYGQTEAYVVGDRKRNFTMSGFIVDGDLFDTDGLTFQYDGRKFIVENAKRDVANNDFQKGEITGVSFPLIE